MSKTTFVDHSTVIEAEWLNEVNTSVFDAIGDGTNAPTTGAQVRANIGAGTGNVTGPGSSIGDRIASFADGTGKVIKDSGVLATSVVVGPATATNDNVAVFDTTTGKLIKDGGATLASKANSGVNSDITSLTAVTSGSVFRKNAIINGDFNVWQRGTSFTIANGDYSADRWRWTQVSTAVGTLSRVTTVPTVAQAGRLFNYALQYDVTTADGSIAAADQVFIEQRVEGYNFLPLAQSPTVLSFWHCHTKTGTYCVSLRNSGDDRSYVAEYTQDSADTWEKATITVTASPSAGTWDYTTGIGLKVCFALAIGANFHGSSGAWQSGGPYFSTANQVNALDSTANNFRICGVQFEAGTVATEFEQRTIQEETQLCERYCKVYSGSPQTILTVSQCISATEARGVLLLSPVMRSSPTVSVAAATSFVIAASSGSGIALTALSSFVNSPTSVGLAITTASSLVAGAAGYLITNSADCRITITAEL